MAFCALLQKKKPYLLSVIKGEQPIYYHPLKANSTKCMIVIPVINDFLPHDQYSVIRRWFREKSLFMAK